MEPSSVSSERGGGGEWSGRPEESGVRSSTTQRGTTRRLLLAAGGLLAGGQAVLGAPEDVRRRNELEAARLKLAQSALETVRRNIGRGRFNAGERDPIDIWSRRRMEARLALATTKGQRVAAAQEHLNEMKGVEDTVDRMHRVGEIDQLSFIDAQYRRLEAESWLEQEQAKV